MPTVDHFKPLRHFPELAYKWSNWIFSCQRCNGDYKKGRWPAVGYVDPSADDQQERPAKFLDYDATTGEIIPKSGLVGEAREKAVRTIEDLGLNSRDVLNSRLDWTRRFAKDWESFPASERPAFAQYATRTGIEFAGATLMAIRQLQASEGM